MAGQDLTLRKLVKIRNALRANSPEQTRALMRIGMLLRSQTIINITRLGLIDTGNLRNSIRYEIYQNGNKAGVMVGSFGVPYAAVHEFGFRGNVKVRSHQRTSQKGKTHNVRAHNRFMSIREKRFLRDAFDQQAKNVAQILREEMTRGK